MQNVQNSHYKNILILKKKSGCRTLLMCICVNLSCYFCCISISGIFRLNLSILHCYDVPGNLICIYNTFNLSQCDYDMSLLNLFVY